MKQELPRNIILNRISEFYINSHDFNGIRADTLAGEMDMEWNELHESLKELISNELVGAIFPDQDVNPHIIRTGFYTPNNQIEKLPASNPSHTCLYPRPKHLARVVDKSNYSDAPYTLRLALGEPMLAYVSFDLSILEYYRNDPRYYYSNNDISGFISVSDEYDKDDYLKEHDRFLLETFGFSYNKNLDRKVAVFLRYLSKLTNDQQKIWEMKEVKGEFSLHPDYYRSAILGEWGQKGSIITAFCIEIHLINQMSEAMGRAPLFKNSYGEYGENKPDNFSFIVRTTLENYNSFVLLLDIMISDNINKDFFDNEVPYVDVKINSYGTSIERAKGTLQILNDWLRRFFQTDDWEPWDKSFEVLKSIRKMRQKPAHSIQPNVFDQKYFRQQRELLIHAYSAMRCLRMMLENHPDVQASTIEVPDWLREGQIWTV